MRTQEQRKVDCFSAILVERHTRKFLERILKLPLLLPSNYKKNLDYDLLLIQEHIKLLVDLKLNINTLQKKLLF